MTQTLLLLPRGCEWLEAAAFWDVFGWNMLLGDKTNGLTAAAPGGCAPSFAAAEGLRIIGCPDWRQIREADFAALALPGGFGRFGYFKSALGPECAALIRAFAAAGKPIAAVCTGAAVLARLGVLQGKRATVYPIEQGYWQRQLVEGGACYVDAPLVRDGHVITARDPAAALPAALSLLAMLSGRENALAIAAAMGYTGDFL
ncbi:MAG: DJ-1/PfpI family protein [Firmicutes bacterium]|nr:DJ-1/PfpI family protein [Bacillota bacterium]